LMAVLGFFVIVALDRLRVRGAILIGIVLVTVLSFFFGGNTYQGVFSLPPPISPTLFALDIPGALAAGILNVVLVFFLVELFDATGTLMGVARRAGLLVEGKMERLNKALLVDSGAIVAGSVLGTSSTTAYIESAAGVQVGGRTGLTALTVAALFLACLFIAGVGRTALRDRAGAAVRRLPDAGRSGRSRLERYHGKHPGGRHRAGHAVYVLDRRGHCVRLHQLRRAQAADGPRPQGETGRLGDRRTVRVQDRLRRSVIARAMRDPVSTHVASHRRCVTISANSRRQCRRARFTNDGPVALRRSGAVRPTLFNGC
jgi:hypothetical protein